MLRREFLKGLAAIPVVGFSVKFLKGDSKKRADIYCGDLFVGSIPANVKPTDFEWQISNCSDFSDYIVLSKEIRLKADDIPRSYRYVRLYVKEVGPSENYIDMGVKKGK